jgi:hypothetical protein
VGHSSDSVVLGATCRGVKRRCVGEVEHTRATIRMQ